VVTTSPGVGEVDSVGDADAVGVGEADADADAGADVEADVDAAVDADCVWTGDAVADGAITPRPTPETIETTRTTSTLVPARCFRVSCDMGRIVKRSAVTGRA
jgi:hypothetical protein